MKKNLFSIMFLLIAVSLSAHIQLPLIFTDNMVLQQQSEAPIWGKATPNHKVEITTSWNSETYRTTAGPDGSWIVKVQTPVAGGPYAITFSDGKKLVLNNVMIGEVWICSGQSNMEMPLAGWGQVLNYEQEIANANYPDIRLLQVDRVTSNRPEYDLKVSTGGWQVCSPATIAGFSSTGYFFGRNLHQNMKNVPVGLINTSWGGTIAEAWTSGETLKNMPDFRDAVQRIETKSNEEILQLYRQEFKEWNTRMIDADKGIVDNRVVWAESAFSDSGWQEMQLPGFWEEKGLADFDGVAWFRKTVDIPSEWNGKELLLNIGAVDDNEITYFNGVEIGKTDGWNVIRTYKVPANLVKSGKAVITVRVADTGGNGGFHGDKESMRITLSAGLSGNSSFIEIAGNWKYKTTVDFKKSGKAPQSPENNPNRPTVLFNAMIHPIVPYAIKGAIWYQGESNADRAYQYRELFPLMIRDWRKQWNSNFPFYFVQLANFMDVQNEPGESDWAELREAQLQTLHLDHTGMAVTIDIGDARDIHPKDKQGVGNRLALAARALTYDQKITYSGPLYRLYTLEGNKIRIAFDHTDGGLKTKDNQPLKGFAIAGPDHRFYWADAVIEGNEIVVSSSKVLFPVAVRYAWGNNPICNLYNGAGLPASPFRTDDWK